MSNEERYRQYAFEALFGLKESGSPEGLEAFVKLVMLLTFADGKIADEEMKYIIGMTTAAGYPTELVEHFENLDPSTINHAELITQLEGQDDLNKKFLMYFAIHACWADREFHPREREATYTAGQEMGLDKGMIDDIARLVARERELKREIIQTLGFDQWRADAS
jgi:hypothetical protein